MAVTRTTLADEYATAIEGCGLVDRSERGKLALTGADAVEFLNGQVSNELLDLQPGDGCYAALLTHKGKMLGDLRILAAEATTGPSGGDRPSGGAGTLSMGTDRPPIELLLDTERVALQALFDTIRRFKVGYRVELHKRTLECSLLSLIGPTADRVVMRAFAFDGASPRASARAAGVRAAGVRAERARASARAQGGDSSEDPHSEDLPSEDPIPLPEVEHAHLPATIAGVPVRLIRTDLGIDLLFNSAALNAVGAAVEAAGAPAVGEDAAEIVRVEHGRPRYGVDIDASTIPQEAGLNERAVSFTKGCYVGQETVARLYYRGKPNRHLRGLRLSAPAAPGAELGLDGRPVGVLGSSVLSPALGPIGMALVRREAQPGATLTVGGPDVTATVVELPFR